MPPLTSESLKKFGGIASYMFVRQGREIFYDRMGLFHADIARKAKVTAPNDAGLFLVGRDKTTQIMLSGGSTGFNFPGTGPERLKTVKYIKEIFKGKRVRVSRVR